MAGLMKILLVVALALGAWWLWRTIQRRGVSGIFSRGPSQPGPAAKPKALEMEKCRICGDFVPGDSRACANDRCPYPAG